jgi:HEAT repeat protein
VRAAALSALVRIGRASVADGEAALTDPSPVVRRRVAELAPALGTLSYLPLLADAEPAVVEAACFAVGEVRDAGAVGKLASIATGHSDPLCRESAVAALGAIGDGAGLPSILEALGDRPAVRRRAVIALAAFEGPEVEAALRRSLTDRDWQVRQAAEDLLGPTEDGSEGA